jgi:U3 small nucleolar RNA-associated protein 4
VYTAGPDQKVAQFTLVNASSSKSEEKGDKQPRGKWIQTSFKRLHVHDVRSLAMFPPYSLAPKAAPLNPAFAPILASGGLDMQVALTPASSADMLVDGESLLNPISRNHVTKFGDALQHRMGFTPSGHGTDVLGMSESKRLIMVRRYRGIGIWRLRELEKQYDEAKPTGWDKVLEMNLQVSGKRSVLIMNTDVD